MYLAKCVGCFSCLQSKENRKKGPKAFQWIAKCLLGKTEIECSREKSTMCKKWGIRPTLPRDRPAWTPRTREEISVELCWLAVTKDLGVPPHISPLKLTARHNPCGRDVTDVIGLTGGTAVEIFQGNNRDAVLCNKRWWISVANIFALFKPPSQTHLGLNNRLQILFRIQTHVFFHSTQLSIAGVSAIRKYSGLCR